MSRRQGIPRPKPKPTGKPRAKPKTKPVVEPVPSVCADYEVGQIPISSFGSLETQPEGAAPGVLNVTSIGFSYVPNHPADTHANMKVVEFSTRDGASTATTRIENLTLSSENATNYKGTGKAIAEFMVDEAFEMSVKLSSDQSDQAPGRLYVHFHCGSDE